MQKHYTEYFSASRQFIQEQKRIPLFGMPDSFILSVSVVNGGCVTIEKVLAPITLCVDFSFGEAYNRMIQKILKNYYGMEYHFKACR